MVGLHTGALQYKGHHTMGLHTWALPHCTEGTIHWGSIRAQPPEYRGHHTVGLRTGPLSNPPPPQPMGLLCVVTSLEDGNAAIGTPLSVMPEETVLFVFISLHVANH